MRTLEDAIRENRKRWARFRKYEAMLRRVYLNVFEYQDAGKAEKAEKVALRIKAILAPAWDTRSRRG